MHETERLSALIGDIYDAALDPTLWVGVLAKSAAFVGGPAASLYSRDVAKRTMAAAYQYGLDPRYVQLAEQKYIKLDPTALGYFIADIEQPVSTADVMPYDEFLASRFYQEWAKPQGLVDTVHAMLDKTVTSSAALVVFRHQRDGLVNDEARRRMRLVVPHFRRAVLIGKVIDLKRAEAASLADTLDGISAGMFLVDASGRIVHANLAGHVMLDAADVLRAEKGRLVVNDTGAVQMLADTFASACNGDTALGVKGIAVPLFSRNGERHIANVLPLTSGTRRLAGASYAAAAALFVYKAELALPSPPEVIAKAYKLTPMELRVLFAVVEVGGVPEVAEALGIAETTVKTHLSNVYKKTSRSRQADLVKLAAEFSNPLFGQS
jgi:DNA-binding CsgD family transcriptional regulator/PAS domain-containing protein